MLDILYKNFMTTVMEYANVSRSMVRDNAANCLNHVPWPYLVICTVHFINHTATYSYTGTDTDTITDTVTDTDTETTQTPTHT